MGLVLLAVAAFSALAATGPVWFCGTCHRAAVASSGQGGHIALSCGSCHATSTAARVDAGRQVAFEMLPARLLGASGAEPNAQGFDDVACRSCHQSVAAGLIDARGTRINHETCATGDGCVDCHGAAGHGDDVRVRRTYSMELCMACHRTVKAPVACDTCHSARTERERLQQGPWQITHGAQWSKTHGLGSIRSCDTCHPEDYCVRCHGTVLPHPAGFGQSHGDEAKPDLKVCASCHDTGTLCTPCHGVEMPHGDGFLKQHSSLVQGLEDPLCTRCHDTEDCVACHVRHVHPGNAAKPAPGGDR